MKYYKIDIKQFYQNDMIAARANGENIPLGNDLFWKMEEGIILDNISVFDFFHLESFDKKEYWNWLLTDVFDFIDESSRIPGWLISKKLKGLLEKFKITEPHFYYLSRLLYKYTKEKSWIITFFSSQEQTLLRRLEQRSILNNEYFLIQLIIKKFLQNLKMNLLMKKKELELSHSKIIQNQGSNSKD
ncbi:hypothetical protein [Chryseobacterium jejuense]|uniref:hypothetical protein n=1 Tax=Chryseobacterium jejuense TaxID=445960 RepID=UPI001AE40F58|nr:hypothetical protein [Chryseobacterium jejuense]MBP2617886.1 hypothetical protein [Chryseobacterium jejuense]